MSSEPTKESQAAPTAIAELANTVARDLPPGWCITLYLENGCGAWCLTDPTEADCSEDAASVDDKFEDVPVKMLAYAITCETTDGRERTW